MMRLWHLHVTLLALAVVAGAGHVAFIAGATGATGRALVSMMLKDGDYSKVIAATRSKDLTAASFPGLAAGVDRSKLRVLTGVDDFNTLDGWALENATVVLCTLGVNEESLEVASNHNFAELYESVDVGFSFALARRALESGTQVYGRVGRADRSFPTKQIWKLFFPKGFIHLRPQRLDRGEMKNQRQKEKELYELHKLDWSYVTVERVAERLLREVREALDREKCAPVPVVVEHDMIVSQEDWFF